MKRTTYNLPNHVHFLTFSCYHRLRLLTDPILRNQLVVLWNEWRRKGNFCIWSYVIMPEHVHLLIYPEDEQYQMSAILRYLKEPFARWVVQHWEKNAPSMLTRITVQRGSRVVRRFWQEGGYDRNLHNWDTIGRAVEYIEFNPVRRGLAKGQLDWCWSSAQARAGAADAPLVLDDIAIAETFVTVECNETRTNVRATPPKLSVVQRCKLARSCARAIKGGTACPREDRFNRQTSLKPRR